MEVKLAECAGFCFGVKRAVDTVYEQLETGKTIYTYGPIVHNEEVVSDLEERGVRVIENRDELLSLDADEDGAERVKAAVIIRAHGVPKEIYDILDTKGIECIDATCPFVKKIHRIVQRESEAGKHIIIVGDPKHPEVEGIMGWCSGRVSVIETPEDAEAFKPQEGIKICIV
ncbi:MAG: 4-hydroxy-3-methylbut-2-enyl diphosphate reductase, partial [Lachnospiraceae bacterium]|nr:4-hydroxy-3-methylbut-2-enyl diphosphate reductase [Lachnospiraceae bacterium]